MARIVNIAHTAFYMVAAYCIYYLSIKFGLNPIPAMLIAVVVVTLLGLLAYKFLIDPIREHEAAVLIATIALAMIFQEVILLIFTGDYLSVISLIEGYFIVDGVKVFYQQLLTFGVVLLMLVVLWFLLMKTRLGLAIRSTAEDREVANLMGMNESRLAMITMGISVALAGFTGAVIVPLTVLSPYMWMEPLIMMMAVVVLGGLGSIKGSFVAAYILGFTEALVVFLIPKGAFLKGSVALTDHDPGPADTAGRSLRRIALRKRGRRHGSAAGLYLRKFYSIVRGEVLVLPSRIIVALFFLVLLGLPLISQNPYLIRDHHPDQHLCHPGRQLGPPVRFHRPDEFRPRPFLRGGGLHLRHAEHQSSYSPLGKRALGGRGRGPDRSYYRDSLSPAEAYLSGPDHHGLSDYFAGDRFCPARSDRRRTGDFRVTAHFQLSHRQLLSSTS